MIQFWKVIWLVILFKCNGCEVFFDFGKIECVIVVVGQVIGEFDLQQVQVFVECVVECLLECVCLDIEWVQDLVEWVLMEVGYYFMVCVYVVYCECYGWLCCECKILVDVVVLMNEYFFCEDWWVCVNVNQGYFFGGLIFNVFGKVIVNYWLDEVYDVDIVVVYCDVDLYIYDFDMFVGYCVGWLLCILLNEGLNGVLGWVEVGLLKYLGSVLGQMVNFFGILQNEWVGVQVFSFFDIYLVFYVCKDCFDYVSVCQVFQEFIYNFNVLLCWGIQMFFINLIFDWVCLDDLCDQVLCIGGEEMFFVYGELQVEMDLINCVYIEVMQVGDVYGWVFIFLILIYNIIYDFFWDSDNVMCLFEMIVCYGLFYFQNFFNLDMQFNQVCLMCCCL